MTKRPYKVSLTAVIIDPDKKGETVFPNPIKTENASTRLNIEIKSNESILWMGYLTFENEPESSEPISIQDLTLRDEENQINTSPLNLPVEDDFILRLQVGLIESKGFTLTLSSIDSTFNSLPCEQWTNELN